MKQKPSRLTRALSIAYGAVFLISLLWTVLVCPAEHMVCLLLHALLGIIGGNLILHYLKNISAWELQRRDIIRCLAVLAGAAVDIALHIILH